MSPRVRAAVLVTGDEVLEGRVGDRNGRFLAADLDARGAEVDRIVVLGDRREAIASQVRALAAEGLDLVVTTGGLGVTHDDLTMEAVADAAGVATALDEGALALVRARSAGHPNIARVDPAVAEAVARKQATLPVGGVTVPPAGTAPGCVLTVGATVVVVLPGPPREVAAMWPDAVRTAPVADVLARVTAPVRRILRVHGVIEAELVERLEGRVPSGVRMGICARPGEIEVVLTETGARPGAADEAAARISDWFGRAVFSTDGADVDDAVAGALLARRQTVAVAESCTGGLVGARLTRRPGSSAYVLGGFVTYADAAKRDLLGVAAEVLGAHGAVSRPVAAAMAEGARGALGADWALSVTGIAGPGGGTPAKPVGLVFVGCAGPAGTRVVENRFRGDRDLVRERSVSAALHLLREALAGG